MPEEIHVPEQVPSMSVLDKFIGVISSPGEFFQSVAGTEPKTSNWALPLVVAIIVSIIFTAVVFNQPAIQDEMQNQQMKQFEKQIAAGKMTQEQADQAMQFSKPGSAMFLVFGSVGVMLVVAFALFAYSTVYFVAGKVVFKSTASYSKVLELNGLGMYIMPVATLVSMVTVIGMGSLFAQPSGALFVSEFDPTNATHKLLAALNVLEFWGLYVTAVAMSKLWKVSFGKAFGVVGGVFVVWTLLKVFGGLSFGGM